jgi:peptidoglycan/LPS O-acetylase OafA/YrhL
MNLAHYAEGRNNNFNLIRILAALAVLVSHSYVVVTGSKEAEPLAALLGVTWGSMAVDVFFITSGFLVTSSLLKRKSIIEFIAARTLRVYPALLPMTFLSIFVLGLTFTSYPAMDFLRDPVTHTFAIKNITLIFGVTGNLPGIFESLPYPRLVNVSLWTLPFEIRMYGILTIIWLAAHALGKVKVTTIRFLILFLTIAALLAHFRDHFFFHATDQFHRLFYMFFLGATFFILREHIVLTRKIFFPVALSLLISTLQQDVFFVVYHIVIAYLLFWIAYIPSGAIRNYNRLGDYSYGVYIYAFPVQQSVAALIPGVSVGGVVLASSAITLFFAFLSWHTIEKRALGLKDRAVKASRWIIGIIQTASPSKSK